MSDDDINKELESLSRVANAEEEREGKAFEEQIKKNLEYGARDRETAIRWIHQVNQ